ncbi:MAG: hypothetical protein ACRBFS_08615 [Aureispira sp.]
MSLLPPTITVINQQLRPVLQALEEERQQLQKQLRLLYYRALGIQILFSLTGLLIGYWIAVIVEASSFLFFAVLWIVTLFVFLGNRHFKEYKTQQQQAYQALLIQVKQSIYTTILSSWKQDVVYHTKTSILKELIKDSLLFPRVNKWEGQHHWTGQFQEGQRFQVAEVFLQQTKEVVEKKRSPYLLHIPIFEGLLVAIEETTPLPLGQSLTLNTHFSIKKDRLSVPKKEKDLEGILDASLALPTKPSHASPFRVEGTSFSTFEALPLAFQKEFSALKEALSSPFFLAFAKNKRYIALKKENIFLEIVPQKSFLAVKVREQLVYNLHQQLTALCFLQELSSPFSSKT